MENKIILYSNKNGKVNISVTYLNDTFWLPQKAIAKLFGVGVPAISKHLKNIFESGELEENSVISKMETTAKCREYIARASSRKSLFRIRTI